MSQFPSIDSTALLLIAQVEGEAAPVLSGKASPQAGTTTGAPGSTQQGAAPPGPPAGGLSQMLIFIVPVLLFFVFISFMGSRREKKRREQLNRIVKHDRVRTRGGIIGSVIEAKEDQLVIKVDESRDTRITLDRQYVDAVLEAAGSEE